MFKPWKIIGAFGNATFIGNQETSNIAAVHGALTQDGEANARLIAAAPELLGIIERYTLPLLAHNAQASPESWEKPLQQTLAVLAKVRGQS